ncbi:DHH family phosphoesterase [Parasphaerochaeta coccoides]|uniref:Phosphoesterase RecJ domain protein n=1 Tax=Parasphaerochaeta coccoides (strain ATCC BAA-1237 / DSM 17374 / SPN1) TaxID=760011 RepID=F4GHC1_PARC1|nr:DHH family phosphoesterase [Parasphaerochaeta coccoides]AEC02020.1 phosphoesterase RecJ domain protein [Parasphaerochaeta coccoides DSM 17374]
MIYPHVPEDIANALRSCKKAIIIGHVAPDGDCCCSEIAMRYLLSKLGTKEILLANAGPFERPEIREWKDSFVSHIPAEWKSDDPLVIVVDCSTLDRIGHLATEIEGLRTLVIDHHSTGVPFGDLRFIFTHSFSTTLLIQHLFVHLGVEIDNFAAEHLFFGFATDTGFFRFIGPGRGETLRMAADLVDAGVSPNEIYDRMTGGRPIESIQYLAALIARIESFYDGKVLLVEDSKEDMVRFGEQNRPSDALYAALLSIDGVQMVIFIKHIDGQSIELGLRSSHSSDIDVGALAGLLGGGGHCKAAGATVQQSIQEVRNFLLTAISEKIN